MRKVKTHQSSFKEWKSFSSVRGGRSARTGHPSTSQKQVSGEAFASAQGQGSREQGAGATQGSKQRSQGGERVPVGHHEGSVPQGQAVGTGQAPSSLVLEVLGFSAGIWGNTAWPPARHCRSQLRALPQETRLIPRKNRISSGPRSPSSPPITSPPAAAAAELLRQRSSPADQPQARPCPAHPFCAHGC